jgi:glycosyltransferase involved in cell wall biosynthesis
MTTNPRDSLRLAVVLSHPTQYYSPWFQWLKLNTDLNFRVFYLWDFGVTKKTDPEFGTVVKWDVDLLSGYDSEFVPNLSRNPGAENFNGFKNPDLMARLASWKPGAVLLFGYKWATHMKLAAWARLNGVPILFRGDSTLIGRPDPKFYVRVALKLLFSQFSSFLYVGQANREYFRKFGVPAKKLFFSPHSVNAALFDANDPDHQARAHQLRVELGLRPSTKVILFAAKLVPVKQPLLLLQTFLRVRPPDTALIFVGDGTEKSNLQMAALTGIGTSDSCSVHFLPFANQSEMPSRYLLADIFVLPSRGDSWGLAVNEAMHMGVPAIVSDRVGCQRDLVNHGETGWVFEFDSTVSLEKVLIEALRDMNSAARGLAIREAATQRIAGYSYAKTAYGLLEALDALGS